MAMELGWDTGYHLGEEIKRILLPELHYHRHMKRTGIFPPPETPVYSGFVSRAWNAADYGAVFWTMVQHKALLML